MSNRLNEHGQSVSDAAANSNVSRIRRNAFAGAILRPFGLGHAGIELDPAGVRLAGQQNRHIAFSRLAGPLKIGSVLGITAIVVREKGGEEHRIAGVNASGAKRFLAACNTSFGKHVEQQYQLVEHELLAITSALGRLEQPRRYPAACFIEPFLERAESALQTLPDEVPEGALSPTQLDVLTVVREFRRAPLDRRAAAIKSFVAVEIEEMREFFDTIESNPLTPEQRLAVVTDDDATLVLAGAGSGKTSVIVAKAAYLIARGDRAPNEILLMAFGSDASAEMAERIKQRSGDAVDALTFHALGNKIIREVEGRAPPLAAHATDAARYRELLRDILLNDVAEKAGLRSVLLEWFSEFYWPYKNEWDFKNKGEYFEWVEAHDLRTLNGDRVRSFEEWEISNWLYRHGVEFEYEPTYEHPLPAGARGAYHPDFRLKESGIYIEHFGVRKVRNADGSTRLATAPYIDCDKYLADMDWKRQLHKDNGTTLIESFSYERVEGCLLQNLREKLAPYVKLAPLEDDRVFAVLSQMGQVDAFTQTLGTFLRHFKSVGADMDRCRKRGELGEGAPRNLAFMKVFEFVYNAYQKRLGEQIDFEDMISRATAHIETGRYQSPYRHILVDEFQDISEGRARLLRALKAQHGEARIFAVGDDWQSIFRFAGSDIHLMRDFGKEFGGKLGTQSDVHSVVDLGRTFRSVDKIALPARAFVLKNPSQIEKQVIAAGTTDTPAIFVAYYDRSQESVALEASLQKIASGSRQKTSVLLLGRYNHVKPKNLSALEAAFPQLSLRFMTAHGSKGLEADHVIILRAASATMGFPSEIVDDPLLELVLPMPERFAHAEERRLFYVALTRARTSVTIIADREKPSAFVRELVENSEYEVMALGDPGVAERHCPACAGRMLAKTDKNGRRYYSCEHRFLCGEMLRACSSCDEGLPAASETRPGFVACSCGAEFAACPECDGGWLVERSGPYGGFLGCVRYPACHGKRAQSGHSKS